jgi:NAD(P)-dependent dehydrogenase (short-subunit alcohol dehydrogenase family)
VRIPKADLAGRRAIVAGASRGIGWAIAAGLVGSGAQVVLTSRSRERAEQAAGEIGDGAVGFEADVTDAIAAKACVDFAVERFGGIDILVNNAAEEPPIERLVDVDHGSFARTVDVNLWAPILWSGLVWRESMREADGGVIVNTASLGGFEVAAGLGVYHMAKAGLVHLTRHLAVELAPRVRVNAVAPGITRTSMSRSVWEGNEEALAAMTPLGRIGEPGDIAPAVAFLCSDAAAWITGETLIVDGGESLGNFDAGAPPSVGA